MGVIAGRLGQFDLAVDLIGKAVSASPDNADYHSDLGIARQSAGWLDEAIASYERALSHRPVFAEAHYNLGAACKETGQLDRAITCYRRALEIRPGFVIAHDDLLNALQCHPACDARSLLAECQVWNRQHAQALSRSILPHPNNRDPMRPLRIGYVSSDFHNHVSAFFLLPLLRSHDSEQVQVFCYAHVAQGDAITRQMQDHVPHWFSTVGMSDSHLAEQIRRDQIDILVDLKLHTAGNRLLVFASKPAPVQVTWLAYPGTTGLNTIDYRLTDPYLDPPGAGDACYSERSIRLPDTFWCYDPLEDELPVRASPCERNGSITFGCLNNFCKMNDRVIDLWAKVLMAVPGSRLILMAPEGKSRSRVLENLGREGIGPDRVGFVARRPHLPYLHTYDGIDIVLDTFPYNGHTTSLDALWMGVPVITLVGNTVVGRAGLSQLTNLGLPELVARSPEQYRQIAVDLATDRLRLAELRSTLRQRMQGSALMDAPRFARGIEAAYRSMWRTWCST